MVALFCLGSKLSNTTKADNLIFEKKLWSEGYRRIAGCDEAGRGCWAGPVCAAVVILHPHTSIDSVTDSKKLSSPKREMLYDIICREALDYGISFVDHQTIDKINILEASKLAMLQALSQLKEPADYLLIDGNFKIKSDLPQEALIKGDSRSISIAAASILAKVSRDRFMVQMAENYPDFNFAKHKAYGTKLHRQELSQFGPSKIHRLSFAPMKFKTK